MEWFKTAQAAPLTLAAYKTSWDHKCPSQLSLQKKQRPISCLPLCFYPRNLHWWSSFLVVPKYFWAAADNLPSSSREAGQVLPAALPGLPCFIPCHVLSLGQWDDHSQVPASLEDPAYVACTSPAADGGLLLTTVLKAVSEAKLLVWPFSTQLQAGWLPFQAFTPKVFPLDGGRASVTSPPASLELVWAQLISAQSRREGFSVLWCREVSVCLPVLAEVPWTQLGFAAVLSRLAVSPGLPEGAPGTLGCCVREGASLVVGSPGLCWRGDAGCSSWGCQIFFSTTILVKSGRTQS